MPASYDSLANEIIIKILELLQDESPLLIKTCAINKRTRACAMRVKGYYSHAFCPVNFEVDDLNCFLTYFSTSPELATKVTRVTIRPRGVPCLSLERGFYIERKPELDGHTLRRVRL